jgi:hypothetical protein
MTFDGALGLALMVCMGLGIFGLVMRFPWFIIQGGLVNGSMIVLCIYFLAKIFGNIDFLGGGWAFALAILVIGFAAICCFNLYNYLSGREAESFYRMVREKMSGGDGD